MQRLPHGAVALSFLLVLFGTAQASGGQREEDDIVSNCVH